MIKENLKAASILVLVLLVILISLQNAALVELNFLWWSFQMNRILLILLVFAIGFLIGHLVSSLSDRRKKAKGQRFS